jgi:antitoxin (DNA-binding transcriptional repressor) of toxin-antitoxin stability system
VHNLVMAKHVIHISEKEAAATNVATLLAHVRAGTEVVIENGARPIAVLHPAEAVRRTIRVHRTASSRLDGHHRSRLRQGCGSSR